MSALLRFFLCGFVATALSLAAQAQTQAGQIVAAKVEGQVMKLAADGSTTPVKNGDKLTETDTVTTAKESGVVLVFMNGSSVKLGAESRLSIDEFKMDPLGEDLEVAKLKAEPSVSKTSLNLSYGEMVGDVKKLNTARGSSYNIKTPVGAAGIRGTIYRIVFKPDANGKAFFQVQTAEGSVVFNSNSGNAAANAATQEVPVEAGKEISVTIDVPDTPGQTFVMPTLVSAELPAETVATISTAVQVIAEVVQQTVIPPTPTPTPTPTPPATTETPPTETKPADPTPTPPAPVTIQVTTPNLTPGAGKPSS